MNLHEYQAKQLFAEYGLPVPHGEVAYNVEEALAVANQIRWHQLGSQSPSACRWRGKAGGVN